MSQKNITIYHNPKCSKSREALEIIKNKKLNFSVVLYLERPLNEEELRKLLKQLKMSPHEIVRTHEDPFLKLGRELEELSGDEVLTLISKNPILLERPIIVCDDVAIIGRPPQKVEQFF